MIFLLVEFIIRSKLVEKVPKLKKGFKIDWEKTDFDSLKIIHEGAKDRVPETVKDHYEISRKYFSLLILVLSISSALFVVLFDDT
tara:strand:+ start:9120 stop:9374 length:255 start_codon:yes stop_codon:yes gene_type:complete